ncbi:MAG TPA: lactate racemase domain-containing protein [Actinomycetota bacterium]|nr:lactate racemase domain-containing protein [Actinomycetota bacterium]
MKDQIVFGDSWLDVDLPDSIIEIPSSLSIPMPGVTDISSSIADAIERPIDRPPLADLARKAKKVLVAFDDATVPCYAPVWEHGLNAIVSALVDGGVDERNIELVCANALHRQFTFDELSRLIGTDLTNRFRDRIGCHDAESPDMVEVGRTATGHVVDLSKKAVDADLVVYLNCSTTRGFSGGWKSISVGLSSYRCIAQHHAPDTMSMSIDRNRMHEVLDEMGGTTEQELGSDTFFKVETVLANPLEPAAFFGGSVGGTRAAALEMNRAHMPPRRTLVEEPCDVILYGVPEWSPYAAYSFNNPILSLVSTGLGYLGGMIEAVGKKGCTVILANPCRDVWDSDRHPSYKEVWDRVLPETKDPYEAKDRYEQEFAERPDYIEKYRNQFAFHGSHGIMALYPLKRLRHAGRVIVAGAESKSTPEHIGFDWASSVEAAIGSAKDDHGSDARIAFVRYPAAFNRA